ncbi:nucleoside hydrolase [Lichenicoccus sp.]|uniref:nucleoside hydrolase n=1 Tax=Lichenicoccus sp. TaxID=2781899 RepID=UPI003D098468
MRPLLYAALAMCLLAVAAAPPPRDVIVDTDIGDDIDDAFALALLLRSPEVRVDLITTSLGDTRLRARLVERFLAAAGRRDIAVAAGPSTRPEARFTQRSWAAVTPPQTFPDAVGKALSLLRASPPGRYTLIALAPLTTVSAMIARDPVAFRRLARVVMMGGSIARGYGARAGETSPTPSIEYNVRCDPAGLRALLAAGVPVEMMPLDATEIALDARARRRIFTAPTPLAPVLASLYEEWAKRNPWGRTPIVFDVVPAARLLRPATCAPVPMDIAVSAQGRTQPVAGPPNASVCLHVDRAIVLGLLAQRLAPRPK